VTGTKTRVSYKIHAELLYCHLTWCQTVRKEEILVRENEPAHISQTTYDSEGQEIQAVILELKKPEEVVEFN